MSVYTSITQQELEQFLAQYDVGLLLKFEGISDGTDNTNYFVTTDKSQEKSQHGTKGESKNKPQNTQFVLTIFERLSKAELPYFMDLTAHLFARDIACPAPIASKTGGYLQTLKDKPAALVERLAGKTVDKISLQKCKDIGQALGKLHLAGLDFEQTQENRRNLKWCQETSTLLKDKISTEDYELLENELQFQSYVNRSELPQGSIHGDLFHDNVMYDKEQFSGIIDFYFAATDMLLYDIAITVNDWCKNDKDNDNLNVEWTKALLTAYHAERPLKGVEHAFWPHMLRAAALSWWVSRLYEMHFPRAGDITDIKDPKFFKKLLLNHIEQHKLNETIWVDDACL